MEPVIEDYIHIEDFYDALDEHHMNDWMDWVKSRIKETNKKQSNKIQDPDDKAVLDKLYKVDKPDVPIATQRDLDKIQNLLRTSKVQGLLLYQRLVDELSKFDFCSLREENGWIDSVYAKWNELEYKATKEKKAQEKQAEDRKARALSTRNNKKYKCHECEVYTNNFKYWEEHITSRSHFEKTNDDHGIERLKCEACGKDDFNSILEVERHKNTLACKELRTCPTCQKICTRKQTFVDHVEKCKDKQELEKQKKLLLLEKLKEELGM